MAPDAHGEVAGQGPGGEPEPQPIGTRAVEVAVVFRTPDGRYNHRRMRCSGSDLKSGLGHLFDPNPETLAYASEPSCPRAVEVHSFEYPDQALEEALAQDPLAHPDKWRSPSSFWAFFDEELANKVEPEAARIGILGSLVAGVAFLAVLAPLLYVVWLLPVWLGIADDAEEGGVSPCSASPLPRRSSRRISSQTRSGDATWPGRRTSSRPGFTPLMPRARPCACASRVYWAESEKTNSACRPRREAIRVSTPRGRCNDVFGSGHAAPPR